MQPHQKFFYFAARGGGWAKCNTGSTFDPSKLAIFSLPSSQIHIICSISSSASFAGADAQPYPPFCIAIRHDQVQMHSCITRFALLFAYTKIHSQKLKEKGKQYWAAPNLTPSSRGFCYILLCKGLPYLTIIKGFIKELIM